MTRPLFIGNGSMLVGLDESGMVHDFYYPYVGLENHTNATDMHHKVGVWVDGRFSWLDDGSWIIKMDYELDAMVGATTAFNKELDLALEFHDFVDCDVNVFARNIHVVNNSNQQRDVRLFMHQIFKISESSRGDTVLYVPDGNYILDYKGRRSFLINGQTTEYDGFDQYSVGIHGIEGKQGTYVDAEDGELSNHPVEHGRVDSTIRFNCNLKPTSSTRINYWVVAAASHADASRINKLYVQEGFAKRYEATQAHWAEWMSKANKQIDKLEHKDKVMFKKALLITKSHMDRRGSVLASGDSAMLNYARDNYSYCWPRDAAYALWPLVRMGYKDEARAFFEFARDVMADNGSLMHKYQPDRAVGSTWHPLIHNKEPELAIQEDETAIVLFLMQQYHRMTGDVDFVKRFYGSFIQPAANFLEGFIDKSTGLPHASYDLWEEKFLTSTYTTAVTCAGLTAAAMLAEEFEYPDDAIRWQTVAEDIRIASQDTFYSKEKQFFIKGFHQDEDGNRQVDDTLDSSSLFGAVMYGLFEIDSKEVQQSLKTLEEKLMNKSPSGGLPRYENDQYCRSDNPYLGNPWFVTTLWMAQIYNELDMQDKIPPIIDWVRSHMAKSGILSEQINPETSEPVSVSPLIWSHAELMNTFLDSVSE